MPIKMKLVFITSKVFWRIVLTFNMCIILIQWAAFLLLKFSNFTTSYKINSTSNNKKLCNRSWNNDSSHIRQTSPNERILLLPIKVYGEGRKEQLQRHTHTHTLLLLFLSILRSLLVLDLQLRCLLLLYKCLSSCFLLSLVSFTGSVLIEYLYLLRFHQ